MTSILPHATPLIELTRPEDTMEISSDTNRPVGADEDIEIDLDLTEDQGQDADNDYMLEDAGSEADAVDHLEEPGSVNDDLMLDEDAVSQTMRDDASVPDEELYDAEDPEHDDSIVTVTGPDRETSTLNGAVQDDASLHDEEIYDVEYPEHDDSIITVTGPDGETSTLNGAVPGDEHHSMEHAISYAEELAEPFVAEEFDLQQDVVNQDQDEQSTAQIIEALTSPKEKTDFHVNNDQEVSNESTKSALPNQRQSPDQHSSTATQNVEEPLELSKPNDETVNEDDSQPGGTDQVHSVHPVIIVYQDSEMSLFPPSDQDPNTYFLQDETLAYQSIGELLQACRIVLDDDISEDDELKITMAELGLQISEDSTFASTISLSQILDIHVRLLQQDGVDNPDPLYMTLGTKIRFSKRFNDLTTAVEENKGMSQVRVWDDQDGEDYDAEDQAYDDGNGEFAEITDVHHPGHNDEVGHDQIESGESNKHDVSSEVTIPAPVTVEPTISDKVDSSKDTEDKNAGPAPNTSSAEVDEGTITNPTMANTEQPNATVSSKASDTGNFEANQQYVTQVEEDAEDLIDYSDEEYVAEQHPSTASSTVKEDTLKTTNGTDFETQNDSDQPNQHTSVPDGNEDADQVGEHEPTTLRHQSADRISTDSVRDQYAKYLANNQVDNGELGEYVEDIDDQDTELQVKDLGLTAPAEDLEGLQHYDESESGLLVDADATNLEYNGMSVKERPEHVEDSGDLDQAVPKAEDERTNGRKHSTPTASTHNQSKVNVPGSSTDAAMAKQKANNYTSGNANQHHDLDNPGDEDLVNFEEDEEEVVVPSGIKGTPTSLLGSSKRSREDDQVPDDNKATPKRIRSG